MKAARQRWFLLGAALLSAIAGLCILLWSWPSDESRDRAVQGMYGVGNPLFSDPAFSPHASIGDIKQATQRAVEELVRAYPDAPDAREVLAHFEQYGNIDGDASRTREIAVQTHLGAGRCYYTHGQVEKAIEMLRKAAILDPENVPPRTELLAIYLQNGHEREALAVCRQLCRIEPGQGDHWLKLGLLRARLDDLEGARSALKRALAIDPSNARYRDAAQLLEKGE
ncbi:MAG: tetratricopeptide repeat protein [Rhodopirellula sp.]|nr:tetratricopeptide repeat protein [Rhodopirellula sp.]